MDDRGFTARWRAHLHHAGEGYFEHMGVACRIGGLLLAAGAACIVHAIIPSLCTDRASRTVRRLHDQIQKRGAKPQPDQNWALEFEI
jgi:hypothetical protein